MNETIGQRLRRLRTARGLTQRQLAEPGVSYAYISRVEAGSRQPSRKALAKIAAKLGVTALYLETGSDLGPCPHCGVDARQAVFYTPGAIRDHFDIDADGAVAAWVEQASEEELEQVAEEALNADVTWAAFHSALTLAVEGRIGVEA